MITIEQMNSASTINGAIEFAKEFYLPYPTAPRVPHLSDKRNLLEVQKYAVNLQEYNQLKLEYEKQQELYKSRSNVVNNLIEEYIKEQAGLNSIPEQYRDKVYSKAYSDGHSEGFYSVYSQLCELVELFNVN